MPRLSTPHRKPAAVVALPILLLACAGLTACGGSSSTTSTTTTDAAANAAATSAATGAASSGTTSTGTTGTTGTTGATSTGTPPGGATGPAGGPGAGRFAAVRECLQKNGITLPARPAGGGPPHRGSGGFLGGANGGPKIPKGMTRAQYEAVIAKCGGNFRGRGGFSGPRAFNSPTFHRALSAFAACLRQNGVNVPEPNTSGKGPVFDTKGIDTSSPQFRQAESKCRSDLLAVLRPKASAGAAGG